MTAEYIKPCDMVWNGKTWRDMPGKEEGDKKLSFAFYRRGMLDLHEEIEDIDDRKERMRKDRMNRAFGYKRSISLPKMKHPDLMLMPSQGGPNIEAMKIVPDTADDLIEVKKAAREWASQMTGHDFTQIQDVVVKPPRVREPAAERSKDQPRAKEGRYAVIHHTTLEERIRIRERITQAAVKLKVTMWDIVRAACGATGEFLAMSCMRKTDSRHYPALVGFVERVELGEVTSVPRALDSNGAHMKKRKEAA